MFDFVRNLWRKIKFYTLLTPETTNLFFIFIFSAVILSAAIIYANSKFRVSGTDSARVSRINAIISSINNVETCLFKTGTAARLYQISKGAAVDTNVHQLYLQAQQDLYNIRTLNKSETSQIPLIDTLGSLIDARYSLWVKLLKLPVNGADKMQDSIAMANIKVFYTTMDVTTRLKDAQHQLLYTYLSTSDKDIKTTARMLGAVALFGMLLILLAFLKLNAEIKKGIEGQILLQSKIHQLDLSNRELQHFAYIASHDLNEPLRRLNNFSGLLESGEKERMSPEGLEILARIQRSVTQMQRLINDLLVFSLNFNKADKKSVDLNKVLDEVLHNMAEKMQQTGAAVDSSVLPQIMGIESQMQQLFQNLLSNSIKYARKGYPPHIKIEVMQVQGSQIKNVRAADNKNIFRKITFADNGIGFDNQYAEKIFVIFQRLHGKSEYEGTGIGLATCKLVVENHEGYITADGNEGQGATFSVFLPIT